MPNKKNTLTEQAIHLKIPTGPKSSGHEVDFGAFSIEEDGKKYRPWIGKLNKHKGPKGVATSMFEVAFSQLAALYMKPGLTPAAKLIMNNQGQVSGIASESYDAHIQGLIAKNTSCYSLKIDGNQWQYKPVKEGHGEDEAFAKALVGIEERATGLTPAMEDTLALQRAAFKNAHQGFSFLVDMPKNFFVDLLEKHTNNEIEIDMASLASALATSYTLEEDDLHKGNIGFYVITEPNSDKKKFVFFKIDHDLMFNNSIMSKLDMRVTSILYDDSSFNISVRDLESFPHLVDSGNHYWPTEVRWTGTGNKQYTRAEAAAFRSLNKYDEFNNEKWASFLKYIVIPDSLLRQSVLMHLDPKEDLDKLNMVTNSAALKAQKLKNVLLQSEQFNAYLDRYGEKALATIKKEIATYLDNAGVAPEEKIASLNEISAACSELIFCSKLSKERLVEKTIRLNCYDFDAKHNIPKEALWDAFQAAKDKLDEYAIRNVSGFVVDKDDSPNAFRNACIIEDLNARIKPADRKELNADGKLDRILEAAKAYKDNYLKATEIKTIADFIQVADKIREVNIPLKQQKNELLDVLKKSQLSKEDLLQLKADISKNEPEQTSLKFVNQLRSNTWFMRLWHGGVYSNKTSTSKAMIEVIDSKLKQLELSDGASHTASYKDRLNAHKTEDALITIEMAAVEEVEEVQVPKTR